MASSIDQIPEELVHDFDPHDQSRSATFVEDMGAAHAKGPVTYSTAYGGHWLITGYEQARQVMTNPTVFSSFPNTLPRHPTLPPTIPIEIDPPDHGTYRDIIAPLFAPGRMRAMEHDIRELTTQLIDGFIDSGECEIISQFAHPLPSGVFLTMMGWSWDDLDLFVKWTDAIIVSRPGLSEEERFRIRQEAVAEYSEYFQTVIDAAREDDADTITSQIVNAVKRDGTPITDAELVNLFGLLMIAGLHTTRGLIANGVIALARHPEVRAKLVADPSLIPAFVEEMLRMHAPSSVGRTVAEETEFAGVTMQPGDRVIVGIPYANFDDKQFDQPFEMVHDREPNRQLAFGVGPHRCAGSHLARVELKVAFEEILCRMPNFELTAEPRFHAGQVRGVSEVKIAIEQNGS